jgi:Meiotically up-regulated gene 113
MKNIQSGLYLVTLNNWVPISVNAQDPRIADKAIKVTRANCKFGKAKNLEARKKNYFKTFGEQNVNFRPVVKLVEIEAIEKEILRRLEDFRIRGRTGRMNEWLEHIAPEQVLAIAVDAIRESGVEYQLLD